jgi:CheY-like chemotaxis protein
MEPRGHAICVIPDSAQLSRFMGYFVPDMIILDFDSSAGDGLSALKWLRGSRSGMLLPVLIASTEPIEDRVCWLPGEDLTKFVSKPVEEERFGLAIKEFFDSDVVGRGGAIIGSAHCNTASTEPDRDTARGI